MLHELDLEFYRSDFTLEPQFLRFCGRIETVLQKAKGSLTIRELKLKLKLFNEQGRVPRKVETYLDAALNELRAKRLIGFNENHPQITRYFWTGEGLKKPKKSKTGEVWRQYHGGREAVKV